MGVTSSFKNFYFGVIHPIAHTLSRLLEEPSLATTFLGVYLYFYFAATCSVLAGHLQAEYTIILWKLTCV
jgi:hypothetical protein